MKKVLILCTGNSCRSIIAEALINAKLEGISADSSGVRASGRVNPNAKKLLEDKGIWKEEYHSKTIDKVIDNAYDLVVTVCDHANETCPMFPKVKKSKQELKINVLKFIELVKDEHIKVGFPETWHVNQ